MERSKGIVTATAAAAIIGLAGSHASAQPLHVYDADEPGNAPDEWLDLQGGVDFFQGPNNADPIAYNTGGDFQASGTTFDASWESQGGQFDELTGDDNWSDIATGQMTVWFRKDFSTLNETPGVLAESGAGFSGSALAVKNDSEGNATLEVAHTVGSDRVGDVELDISSLSDDDYIQATVQFAGDGLDDDDSTQDAGYRLFAREVDPGSNGTQDMVSTQGVTREITSTDDQGNTVIDREEGAGFGGTTGANPAGIFNTNGNNSGGDAAGDIVPQGEDITAPFAGEISRVSLREDNLGQTARKQSFDAFANPPSLEINPATGDAAIVNPDDGSAFSIDFYSIASEGGNLDPSQWNSLQDQGFAGGNPDTGTGWAEAGGSDSDQLAEALLAGASEIAPGSRIDLGSITGGNSVSLSDLNFTFQSDDFGLLQGFTEELAVLLGDMNGDGEVNNLDINPFVLGLTDEEAFEQQFGQDPAVAGDINGDGQFNNLDINPFVNLLTGGSGLQAVPEPASLALLGLGGVTLLRRRRRG